MVIVIGEILIDRFPDYERIGGAPFNFAFHLKNMGIPVQFISRIGDDSDGQNIIRMLDQNGFRAEDIQIDTMHPTGSVEVTLDDKGIPDFDIKKDAAYDFIDLSAYSKENGLQPDMIYFGTLAQRTEKSFDQFQKLLNRKAAASICFCDINLRAPHYRASTIEASLRYADILKLNDEELVEVSKRCNGPDQKRSIIHWLMQEYHISKIALTSGSDGSRLITRGLTIKSPPPKSSKIVDTVGAGDAYAAVLAAGVLKGLPHDRVLELATGFAAHICGLPGAVPHDKLAYSNLQREFERISNDR